MRSALAAGLLLAAFCFRAPAAFAGDPTSGVAGLDPAALAPDPTAITLAAERTATPTAWAITATVEGQGTITPGGIVFVTQGTDQTFTIAPADCFHVANVTVDGMAQGPLSSYTFTNVQNTHFITASFIGDDRTITAWTGPGGIISPAGSVTRPCGSDQTFTISADACHQVADLLVDGVSQGPLTSYTFTNIRTAHTISAAFEGMGYTIHATAGPGGAISPEGDVTLACGSTQTFTINGVDCHAIADVIVDGVSRGALTSYTFTDVRGPHTIAATFTPDSLATFTIAASAGPGGGISPSGDVAVPCGTDQTFTITPGPCQHIVDVAVDHRSIGPYSQYTFQNVVAAHTISASFAVTMFAITASAGAGGTISPPGTSNVNCGASQSYTITPTGCRAVADVVVDGASQGPRTSYTFTDIQASHSITATFRADSSITFPITSSAGTGGTISPSGNVMVPCGSSQTFSIEAAPCNVVAGVAVDGVSQGPLSRYTFSNVQGAHSITATFAPSVPTVFVQVGKCLSDWSLGQPYVSGGHLQPNHTYPVDVRPARCTTMPAGVALGESASVWTDFQGEIHATLRCYVPGDYRLVIDVAANHVYDPDCDPVACFSFGFAEPVTGIEDLQGSIAPDGPRLSWRVPDPTVYRGFNVYRASDGASETRLTAEPLAAPGSGPASMTWRDPDAAPGTRYAYRVEALKADGSDWYGPVRLTTLPDALALRSATPNPFRTATQLVVDVPLGARVGYLEVFDASGRHVRRLARDITSPGQHVIAWDGSDDRGTPVRSGVYLVRLGSPLGPRVLRVIRAK